MKGLMVKIFLICSLSASAQENTQSIIDQFFSIYKDNPTEAVDYIFSTSEWMQDSKDQIDNVKSQLERTIQLVGSYKGANEIYSKVIADDHLSKVVVLVRHERQPLRFNFIFYKANEKWAIYNFRFDDSLDEELN